MRSKQTKAVRYAVVGLGHFAQAAVLPAFKKKNTKSTLVALVSGTDKKLKKLGKEYKIENLLSYSDYEDFLSSGEVDAVYIALPNTMHFEYSALALKNGIHVLCEKPLCPTVKECQKLINIAKENKVKLMTAYRLHFEPINLKIADLAKKNKIGEPLIFNSLFSYQIKDSNIRLEEELAGGAVFDIGIYCINAARTIFGAEPEAVSARLIKGQDKRFKEVDGTVNASLYFPDNKIATFTASFAAYEKSYYEVIGSKGFMRAEPAYEYAEGLSFTLKTANTKKIFKHKKVDQLAAELNYFSQCIIKNKKVESDGYEGLADIRIIEAIQESSESGKLIKLAPFDTDRPDKSQQRSYRAFHRKPVTTGVTSASS